MRHEPETEDDAVPYGTSHSDCGAPSALAETDGANLHGKRQPSRYRPGHRRKRVRYIEMPMGYRTPCYVWQLAKLANGYGMCWDATLGKMVSAHRFYYEREYGPIPVNLQCDHLCRNRDCVRPDHIEPVTQVENIRRGRATKLTPEAVYEIRCSPETQTVLARRYGVGQGHISRIKNNHTWRDTKSGGLA